MFALASDPIVTGKIDRTDVFIVIGKTIVIFGLLLISVMLYIWFLRRLIAFMRQRYGPNRVGPAGLFQTIADGIKLFFKEQNIPDASDRGVFRLAPYVSALTAFLAFAIVPIGGAVVIAGRTTFLQLADLPVGILWLLAMSGLGVYGVMLAGWSSGSKYPLLGSVRTSAQLLSYEAAFGLAIVGVLIQAGTLSTHEIVQQQAWTGWGSISTWFIFPTALVSFIIFVIAAVAETNHPPFDMVEAEQELVSGFNTEYSGVRFAILYLSEFMNLITMSAIAVTLFLGGPAGPPLAGVARDGWINAWVVPTFWFFFKLLILLFGTVWIRASLPRLRYDQLMSFGWKYLIEFAFLWVMLSALIRVARDQGWNLLLVGTAGGLVVIIVLYLLYICARPQDDVISENVV